MSTGLLFLSSLIFLVLVVCSVYTLSKDIDASPGLLLRKMLYRLAQLAGLLAALALAVYFLGFL